MRSRDSASRQPQPLPTFSHMILTQRKSGERLSSSACAVDRWVNASARLRASVGADMAGEQGARVQRTAAAAILRVGHEWWATSWG